MNLCLMLLNTCYLEILPFLTEGLSSDTPFYLGSVVNTTMEPEMKEANIPN
jgi:hypothetical protein